MFVVNVGFVLYKRCDWVQGMVAPGEDVSATLKREFSEETMNSLEMPSTELREIKRRVRETFKNGREVRVCRRGGSVGISEPCVR